MFSKNKKNLAVKLFLLASIAALVWFVRGQWQIESGAKAQSAAGSGFEENPDMLMDFDGSDEYIPKSGAENQAKATAATSTPAPTKKLKYLLHYGTAPPYKKLPDELSKKDALVRSSPFDSFASTLEEKCEPAPSYSSFQGAMDVVKKSPKKFWPKMQLIRIAGRNHDCGFDGYNNKGSIKNVLDLWNKNGHLSDFKSLFRTSLKIAEETGAPGIFIDPESYASYFNNNLEKVAYWNGVLWGIPTSSDDVQARLIAIGGELADIVKEEYPGAVVWISHGADPFRIIADSGKYISAYYIMQGMLNKKIQVAALGDTYADASKGDTVAIWYLYPSQEKLNAILDARYAQFNKGNIPSIPSGKSFLGEYPSFNLAGTAGLYVDKTKFKETDVWAESFRERFGFEITSADNKINKLDDFIPLLKRLFETNEYVWIYRGYGTPVTVDGKYGYDDFDPVQAAKYRPAIQAALKGNGICEPTRNETCENTPEDCGVCPPAPLTGDINGDGKVDQADFDILKADFLKTAPANPKSDIDGDGMVTVKDAGILMSEWK